MKTPADKLYAVAEGQQGYFTAAQAVSTGYPTSNHGRQCRYGSWTREYRGIYRLARFPASPEGQYVLWSLWSRNREGEPMGVFSHQTALSLSDLSDLMPAHLHMTVPPGFRRSAPIPSVLILHYAKLEPHEIEVHQGYRIVRPLRAITDLLHEGATDSAQLRLALQQAVARGLVTRTELERHPDHRILRSLLNRRRK